MKALSRVERASAKLATAFQVVFNTTSEHVDTATATDTDTDTDTGEIAPPEVESFEAMWERIEAVVPRHELAAPIAALVTAAGRQERVIAVRPCGSARRGRGSGCARARRCG